MSDKSPAIPVAITAVKDLLSPRQPPPMIESLTDDGVLSLRWRRINRVHGHRVLGAFETVNGDAEWKGRRIILIETTEDNFGAAAQQDPIYTHVWSYCIEENDRLVSAGMRHQYLKTLDLAPGEEFTYRQRRRRVLPMEAIAAAGHGRVLSVDGLGFGFNGPPVPWPEPPAPALEEPDLPQP